MNKNKKIASILMATTALGVLGVGSFAYFTDRADTSVQATAGTVDLTPNFSGINLLDAEGQDILNPGDMRAFNFSMTNDGNKSVDVRTTLKLTSSVKMTDENGQAQFELYNKNDVEEVVGEGYKPKEGAKPIAVREMASDGMSITYKIPDYVLNGKDTGKGAETETEANGQTSYTYDYVLVMRGTSTNEFQNASVKVDVLAEAKQHRNTSAGWNVVTQESVTVGEMTQDAVPER